MYFKLLCITDKWTLIESFSKPEDCVREPSPNRDIFYRLCPFCPTNLKGINCLEKHILKLHKPLLLPHKKCNDIKSVDFLNKLIYTSKF